MSSSRSRCRRPTVSTSCASRRRCEAFEPRTGAWKGSSPADRNVGATSPRRGALILASRAGRRHKRTMITTRNSTRRSFIKSTATLTAVAPWVLPSRIWSAETKPNERLTLGFIGMGTQNRGLMAGLLSKKETQTLAVCDVDATRLENAKKIVEDHYAKQTGADY